MRVFAALSEPYPVDQVALSADGRLAAVAGGDRVAVWDLVAGRPVWEVPGPPAAQLAFSLDGAWVAAGYPAGVAVRPAAGTADWRAVGTGPGFGGGIAFDPDGRHLLATRAVPPPAYSYDPRPRGRLDRWTVPGWHPVPGPEIATAFARLAVSGDGDWLAGITPGEFEVRFTNTGGLSTRKEAFHQFARRVGSRAAFRSPEYLFLSFAPDGGAVAFGWDLDLQVVDPNGRDIRRVRSPGPAFRDAGFTGSGRHLGTVDGTPVLKLWDAAAWQVVREYDWGAGPLARVGFTADGTAGACGTADGRLVVFDLDD